MSDAFSSCRPLVMNSWPRNDPADTPSSIRASNQPTGTAAWGQLKARGTEDSIAVLVWNHSATTMAGSDLPMNLQGGKDTEGCWDTAGSKYRHEHYHCWDTAGSTGCVRCRLGPPFIVCWHVLAHALHLQLPDACAVDGTTHQWLEIVPGVAQRT
jgi:hypothetical protein